MFVDPQFNASKICDWYGYGTSDDLITLDTNLYNIIGYFDQDYASEVSKYIRLQYY